MRVLLALALVATVPLASGVGHDEPFRMRAVATAEPSQVVMQFEGRAYLWDDFFHCIVGGIGGWGTLTLADGSTHDAGIWGCGGTGVWEFQIYTYDSSYHDWHKLMGPDNALVGTSFDDALGEVVARGCYGSLPGACALD